MRSDHTSMPGVDLPAFDMFFLVDSWPRARLYHLDSVGGENSGETTSTDSAEGLGTFHSQVSCTRSSERSDCSGLMVLVNATSFLGIIRDSTRGVHLKKSGVNCGYSF